MICPMMLLSILGLIASASPSSTASCLAGDCVDGVGKQTTAEGTYQGAFHGGKKAGQGSFISSNGRVRYVGEWKDDAAWGDGTFTWPRGECKGQWKRDQKHGRNRCTWHGGRSYDGEWVEDKRHGQGASAHRGQIYR